MIRGEVIRELMCNMSINKNKINEKYSIDFDQYFAEDIPLLKPFIDDGLLSNTQNNIRVDQKARLLIRNICMSFDANLKQKLNQHRFSQVI